MRSLLLLLAVWALPASALAAPHSASAGQAQLAWQPHFEFDRGEGADASDLTLEERRAMQARLKVRRKLVDVHTILSFVAAGSLVATDIIGAGNLAAIETASPARSKLEPPLGLHRALAVTSSASYLGAGVAAWTMPRALRLNTVKASKKVDSGDLHVAFSVIHGISMGLVVATGLAQANLVPASEGWEHVMRVHLGAGATAATFVIGGAIVIGTM
jgi:hypothetical protein